MKYSDNVMRDTHSGYQVVLCFLPAVQALN